MIRRILIGLVPALTALTLLAGAPAAGACGIEAVSAQQIYVPSKSSSAKRTLHEESNDASLNGRADDQDDPDRLVRVAAAIDWPVFAAERVTLRLAQLVLHTHRPCAKPPRGPPTA